VPFDEPSWWYAPPGADARQRLLRPLSRVYGWAAARRLAAPPRHISSRPVICIGNFTAGGTGKTPLTLACVDILAARGRRVAVLIRGYGGRQTAARFVNADADRAEDVGDEPLLMSRTVVVVVARDRVAGARQIEAVDPRYDVIVMDDGLQSPDLAKDLAIAVIDARRGLGNGDVIPAGPVRAPLAAQLPHVDAVVVNQPPGMAEDDLGHAAWLRRNFEGPVLVARPAPASAIEDLHDAPVVAFAGIANPGRFFDLLTALGIEVTERIIFPDHHAFTEADARRLIARQDGGRRRLVTTEKDWVRLMGHAGARGDLRARTSTLPIRLTFSERDGTRLEALLDGGLARAGGSAA
jgi:tetraacyldisaccharide 4'-kinase